MSGYPVVRLGGAEYVIVPKKEFTSLEKRAGVVAPRRGAVDAAAYAKASLAASVRRARESAGLSQADLAARLKVSQPMIARAEGGDARISERYVRRVLKACRLPADWK